MSLWSESSKSQRAEIRRVMLREAEKALAGMFASKSQLRAAARVMVDKAIAAENQTGESQCTQSPK